jgi:hypothetical protein
MDQSYASALRKRLGELDRHDDPPRCAGIRTDVSDSDPSHLSMTVENRPPDKPGDNREFTII